MTRFFRTTTQRPPITAISVVLPTQVAHPRSPCRIPRADREIQRYRLRRASLIHGQNCRSSRAREAVLWQQMCRSYVLSHFSCRRHSISCRGARKTDQAVRTVREPASPEACCSCWHQTCGWQGCLARAFQAESLARSYGSEACKDGTDGQGPRSRHRDSQQPRRGNRRKLTGKWSVDATPVAAVPGNRCATGPLRVKLKTQNKPA